MPKKKANTIIEFGNDKEQVKLKQIPQSPDNLKENVSNSKTDMDMDTKDSELASKIIRELYRHYGTKDSHTNKGVYHGVMFEVARLSGKPISEVIDKWPKFEIFSILDKVKEAVREELKNEPTIIYQMVMNSKIIADRILAKVIVKSMFC
jgi:hypothetical protein